MPEQSLEVSWSQVVTLFVRGGVGTLLLLAGGSKVFRLRAFTRTVRRYELIPPGAAPVIARLVIAAEVLLGTLLLLGIALSLVLVLSGLLLMVFAAAVTVNLLRGRSFDCGCSSLESRDISWAHVVRNACFGLITVGAGFFAPSVPVEATLPALGVMLGGFAIPALVAAERSAAAVTPYPVRSTIVNFSRLYSAHAQTGEPARGRASANEER